MKTKRRRKKFELKFKFCYFFVVSDEAEILNFLLLEEVRFAGPFLLLFYRWKNVGQGQFSLYLYFIGENCVKSSFARIPG